MPRRGCVRSDRSPHDMGGVCSPAGAGGWVHLIWWSRPSHNGQVHFAQHPNTLSTSLKAVQPATGARELPLSSVATPLGRKEQIAEPCYLQAFKWVIES